MLARHGASLQRHGRLPAPGSARVEPVGTLAPQVAMAEESSESVSCTIGGITVVSNATNTKGILFSFGESGPGSNSVNVYKNLENGEVIYTHKGSVVDTPDESLLSLIEPNQFDHCIISTKNGSYKVTKIIIHSDDEKDGSRVEDAEAG